MTCCSFLPPQCTQASCQICKKCKRNKGCEIDAGTKCNTERNGQPEGECDSSGVCIADPCKSKNTDDLCDVPGTGRKKNGKCKRGPHSNGPDDSVLFCVRALGGSGWGAYLVFEVANNHVLSHLLQEARPAASCVCPPCYTCDYDDETGDSICVPQSTGSTCTAIQPGPDGDTINSVTFSGTCSSTGVCITVCCVCGMCMVCSTCVTHSALTHTERLRGVDHNFGMHTKRRQWEMYTGWHKQWHQSCSAVLPARPCQGIVNIDIVNIEIVLVVGVYARLHLCAHPYYTVYRCRLFCMPRMQSQCGLCEFVIRHLRPGHQRPNWHMHEWSVYCGMFP